MTSDFYFLAILRDCGKICLTFIFVANFSDFLFFDKFLSDFELCAGCRRVPNGRPKGAVL